MKTVKIEFDERYHSILTEMAETEFRTIKATVEMIVVKYLSNRLCDKQQTTLQFPPNTR